MEITMLRTINYYNTENGWVSLTKFAPLRRGDDGC
jgi:hypothetical protein